MSAARSRASGDTISPAADSKLKSQRSASHKGPGMPLSDRNSAPSESGSAPSDDALIRNVSDTARLVAVDRAVESERPDALFRDPFARRLAGERGARIAKSNPLGGPKH